MEVIMLRRVSLLFVGVLAAVGVDFSGLQLAPAAAPMSKHWPADATSRASVVPFVVGVALLVGVLLAWMPNILAAWMW
jgi:hypothetical protein